MAMKPHEPDDPMELAGIPVPALPGHDAVEEMARCFIEEFLRMGWSEKAVLGLFRKPFYRGPHTVYRARGEAYVQGLIAQAIHALRIPGSLPQRNGAGEEA